MRTELLRFNGAVERDPEREVGFDPPIPTTKRLSARGLPDGPSLRIQAFGWDVRGLREVRW
jgi:hypothetical protein